MLSSSATRSVFVSFVLLLGLAACSGGGGTTSSALPVLDTSSSAGQTPDKRLRPTPSPGPSTTPTPAPSTTPSGFSVTGQIARVDTNGFLLQGGPNCGYIGVTTSGATTVAANGQNLAVGVYAEVWGSGNCSTAITASAVSLAASASGPFPAPALPSTPTSGTQPPSGTPTPSTVQTPVPTPTPAAPAPIAGLSPNNYVNIVNGQPWPTNFRPYNQYIWNNLLPTHPQNVNATATTASKQYWVGGTYQYYAANTQNDFSQPVYLASNSDPVVNVNCAAYQYGCNPGVPSTIHVPAKARSVLSSDGNMAVIEPDGTEVDFWAVTPLGRDWQNGDTISAGIAAQSSITGSGAPAVESATNGAAMAAGLIRFSELNARNIDHALFMVVPCTNASLDYPGTSAPGNCPGGIATGSHIYLNCDHTCIDALGAAPAYLNPILYALHDYGGYVLNNGCSGGSTPGPPCFHFEAPTQYWAFGGTYPGDAFAAAHGWTNGGQSIISPETINWDLLRPYLEVLSPCYAQGTCSN